MKQYSASIVSLYFNPVHSARIHTYMHASGSCSVPLPPKGKSGRTRAARSHPLYSYHGVPHTRLRFILAELHPTYERGQLPRIYEPPIICFPLPDL